MRPPLSIQACFLIDPSDKECTSASCYDCYDGPDDKPLWRINERIYQVDCLNVDMALDPQRGETYKWAIACGAVSALSIPDQSLALGEYGCAAFRESSASFGSANLSFFLPCHRIQLSECGCAPSYVYSWGLPDPTNVCATENDCPFLCSDAGMEKVKNLCHVFPGIHWWEGDNFMNMDLFDNKFEASVLEIYLNED